VYPFGNAVGMDIMPLRGESITQKNLGDYIYTTPRSDAKKVE
jgi:hypothetical protein